MIRECFEHSTGIVFDARMLQAVGLPVYHESGPGFTQSHEGDSGYRLVPLYVWKPQKASTLPGREIKPALILDSFTGFFQAIRRAWPYAGVRSSPGKWTPIQPLDLTSWHDTSAEYEKEQEILDIDTQIHCQLEEKPLWLLLELIPLWVERHNPAGKRLEYRQRFQWL